MQEADKRLCTLCGDTIDASEARSVTTIVGASGKPNERIRAANGKVIHQCQIPRLVRRTSQTTQPNPWSRKAALSHPAYRRRAKG
jgi:hypothetical protein